jgi:hypothetical protein
MQVVFPEIKRSEILVNPDDISRLLGSQEGSLDSHSAALVDQYIRECSKIMTPYAAYVLAEVLEPESPEEIAIGGLSFHAGKIVHNMLKQSETFAFFMLTAGPELEARARALLEKGDYLEGYIMDLVASATVEAVADQLHAHIQEKAKNKGLKITNRYSPGYCTWDVAEQQKLFSIFPDKCCGITLTESSLMSPVKSTSGIIGMGPDVKFNEYTCEICPMKNCMFSKPKNHL